MAPRIERILGPRLTKAVQIAWCLQVSFGLLAASSLFHGTGAEDAALLSPGGLEAFDFFRVRRAQLISNVETTIAWLALGQLLVWTAHYGMMRAAIADHCPHARPGGHLLSASAFVASRLLMRTLQVGLSVVLLRFFASLPAKVEGESFAGIISGLVVLASLTAALVWLVRGACDHIVLGLSSGQSGPALWPRAGVDWLVARTWASLPGLGSVSLLLAISGQSAWSLPAGGAWGLTLVSVCGALALWFSVAGEGWWLRRLVQLVPKRSEAAHSGLAARNGAAQTFRRRRLR